MDKIAVAFAMFAILVGGVVALPNITEADASQEIATLRKGDKLPIAGCVDQTWPNLSAACLRGAAAQAAVRTVR